MTLHIWTTPTRVMFWRLPDWTPDLELIIERLGEIYWKVEKR